MVKKKQIIVGVLAASIVVGVLAGVKFFQLSAAMSGAAMQGPPPEAVTSYVATAETWPATYQVLGSLRAVQGATLGAEESGKVVNITFDSGVDVQAGQVLLELDTSVERAQLNGVKAQLELAEITATRQRALRKKSANSQSDLDAAESNLRDLQAGVARLEALIQRKQVSAPFAGRVGIRTVNVGDMVSQGDKIVTLTSFDKLYLDFSLPQRALGKINLDGRVEARIDAFPEEVFSGKVTAIESQVDPVTRNISIQATLNNQKKKLRPGMFATVTAFLKEQDSVVSIPASSISYAPYGDSVWVIGPEKEAGAPRSVESKIIQLGRRRGDRIAIEAGLKAGQEVVSSATFKMRPGVLVVVNNTVRPGNELFPDPKDT